MDIYKTLDDLKEGQAKMLELLNNQLNSNSHERIYDLADLQRMLHVSKRTIATWLQQRLLPHTRVGAKIWVTEVQLNSFLEKHSNESSVGFGIKRNLKGS